VEFLRFKMEKELASQALEDTGASRARSSA
jgi:hypothetical protein